MKKRLCFVVQRYGLEVNGGAELHCRQLAEHMKSRYDDIHVLTNKAVDYMTWENVYKDDDEMLNGIHVHRFSVAHPRNKSEFDEINGRFLSGNFRQSEEMEWIEKQGPFMPDLIAYLRENKDNYDVFIFFTYLYYPTVLGIPEVADKAIVIPTAHDEPFLKMSIFDNVFLKPRAFFFNTEEERILIHNKYKNEGIPSELGGVGVDVPEVVCGDDFKKKYNVDNYVIYVGRIDEGKNCPQMFEYFIRYKESHPNGIKLVLVGKAVIQVPKHKDIISLGFLEEDQDKFDAIKGAKALWLPSKFESLSMVVLEAMSVGTPVIVDGDCEVLKGHCTKSNGAFYYKNYEEFEKELDFVLSNTSAVTAMCKNAQRYVNENYQWNIIVEKLTNIIEECV